jgi:hypothetical protein
MDDVVKERKPIEELIPVERAELYRNDAPAKETDQLRYWREALEGKCIETEKGSPRAGYYRDQSGKAVYAIWYVDGIVQCETNKYRDRGESMTADQIDEAFGWICRYPIPFELYSEAIAGKHLPPEYCTRLSLKEIQACVAWTPALGKQKLVAKDIETFDENGQERPGIGHNNPPEALPPDQALAKRIHDLGVQLKACLDKIGGAPKTQAEAEILAGYANKFKDFENDAVTAHKAEKQPFLDGGRAVDAKWFAPVRDKASASRAKIVTIIHAFEDAENARLAEEARIANEAAKKAAEASARTLDDVPPTAPEIVPEKAKVSSLRGGTRKVEPIITDLKAFLTYCAMLNTIPPDIAEAAERVARKFKAAGVKAPGMSGEAKGNAA